MRVPGALSRLRPALRSRGLHLRTSLVVFLILVVVTVGVSLLTQHVVNDQEHKLLSEKSMEISLILQEAVAPIPAELTNLGHLADTDPRLFTSEAGYDLPTTRTQAVAILRPDRAGRGYVVDTVVGQGLTAGQILTGAAAVAAAQARSPAAKGGMITTAVYQTGGQRALGFVVASPGGIVVYRQTELGPPGAPASASASANRATFRDVKVILYASGRPQPAQVLATTAGKQASLDSSAIYTPVHAGQSNWLVGVEPAQPLVGSVAAYAPWALLVIGLAGAGLVVVLMESVVRRRNATLLLYQAEHRFAETLQRRLLSPLVSPPGLDVASRYVAASDDQQVGGDWFDVFPLEDGRVGVAIGDVMGHDVEAAAAMAQVRAGLRAYAIEGTSPGDVVGRLALLIEMFEIALIVTVVYGVIDRPGPDGSRSFRWSNAGHLPPILRTASGEVRELLGGTSPVLGAPSPGDRSEGECVMPPGSTVVLYTDGLVEVHGVDLTDSLAALCRALGAGAGEGSAEDICEAVLRVQLPERCADDIALVAVQVETAEMSLPAEGEVIPVP